MRSECSGGLRSSTIMIPSFALEGVESKYRRLFFGEQIYKPDPASDSITTWRVSAREHALLFVELRTKAALELTMA